MLLGHNDSEIKMLKNRKGIWKKNSNMAIVGAPDDIIKEIKKYIVVSGVKYFTIHFSDLPNLRSLNLFAKSVIPHFRNGQLR